MPKGLGPRIFVAVLLLITLAYCYGLGWIAWGFLRAGGVIGYGLALGIALLLGLTVWVTWREVLFGLGTARLAREYTPPADGGAHGANGTDGGEGADGADGADGTTGGKGADGAVPAPADPRAEFEAARAAVEDGGQDDWQAWYRLGLAYDALHDRRHARMATRRALEARGR